MFILLTFNVNSLACISHLHADAFLLCISIVSNACHAWRFDSSLSSSLKSFQFRRIVVVVILFHLPISWVFILVSFSNPIEPDSFFFSLSIIFHSLCCYFGTLFISITLSHTHAFSLLSFYYDIWRWNEKNQFLPFFCLYLAVCLLLDSRCNRFFISVI